MILPKTAQKESHSHSAVGRAVRNNRLPNLEPPPGKPVPKSQLNSQQVLHLVAAKETRIGESVLAH